MKIGIDAKWYFSGPPSGRVVVRNLVDNLINENNSNELFLYLRLSEKEKCLEHFKDSIDEDKVKLKFISSNLNFFTNMFILQRKAIRDGIDIFLYQNFTPLFPSKKIKNIAYVHDLLFLDYPQYFSFFENLLYRLIPFLIKKANWIVTISNSEKNRISRHLKFPIQKILVVHHGVNESFQAPVEKCGNDINEKYNLPSEYVLYIGRINIRKNIPTLLKAIALTKMNLVLIGKKEHKSFDLEKFIDKLNLRGRVYTLGFIPENDLQSILSNAQIFCFPSFAEGFGLPPLEAFKAGVPVITANGTSLPEICSDSALYFEPYDHIDLAKKIEYLSNNPDVLKLYSQKGIERAKNFTWKKSSNLLLTLFEEVV